MNKCDPETLCAICLKPFEQNDNSNRYIKKLKCGHVFHPCCINKWMHRKFDCPCCRAKMYEENEQLGSMLNNVILEDVVMIDRRRALRRRLNITQERRLVEYGDLFE